MFRSFLSLALLLEFVGFLFIFLDKKSIIDHTMTLGDAGNIIVLIITAWMVWIYTEEAQKSNEIQEKPILNMYLKLNERDGKYSILKLKNVGKGPAYNVAISTIHAESFLYSFSFNEPNFILGFDQGREISFGVTTPSGGAEYYSNENSLTFELFLDRLFPRNADPSVHDSKKRESAVFLINFEDINSRKYYAVFRLYPKYWPLLGVYDLAIEYIEADSGRLSINQAKKIASQKNLIFI